MKGVAYIPPSARSTIPSLRSVKVISYNILAPKYAGYNSYCPPQYLNWEYRREGVLRELDQHGADLVGLQECDEGFFNTQLKDWMARNGMEGEFLPRQVGPISGPTEGIALLWRQSALELVSRRSVVFADLDPRVAGLPAEVAGTQPWAKLRTLGEGALMAVLRHRPTGQLLVGAVTHLFWDPAFPDIKALQAALLCGVMADLARSQEAAATPSSPTSAAAAAAAAGAGDPIAAAAAAAPSSSRSDPLPPPPPLPMVLCGDFNSLAVKYLPDRFDPQVPPTGLVSGVYSLLSTGGLPPDHPDHPASRVWAGEDPAGGAPGASGRFPAVSLTAAGLQLASLNAEAFGREPPVTNRSAGFAGCLDFVWFSATHFAVASALSMPYDDGWSPPMGPAAAAAAAALRSNDVGDSLSWRDPLKDIAFGAIPDEFYPSDHLAVGGEVLLVSNRSGPERGV